MRSQGYDGIARAELPAYPRLLPVHGDDGYRCRLAAAIHDPPKLWPLAAFNPQCALTAEPNQTGQDSCAA